MAWLLALVANAVLLAWAVAGQVTDLTTVVALLSLGAVTRHVAVPTAGVAGLATTTGTASVATTGAAVSPTLTVTSLGAVAGNVTDLTTLVTFGATAAAAAATTLTRRSARSTATTRVGVVSTSCLVGAISADVASLSTAVAGLLLGWSGAFTAQVSIETAVVAHRVSTLRTFPGLMTSPAAVVAAATAVASTTRLIIHCVGVWRGSYVLF